MTVRSPAPDVSIPDTPLTPFLLESARRGPEKAAFIDASTGRVLTCGQWAGAVERVAGALGARGAGRGQVSAIFAPNSLDYAIAFHGIALSGGIVTTANPLYTEEELAFQLRDSGARRLFTAAACLEKARAAAQRCGVEEVVVFGEGPGATPFAALLEGKPAPPPALDPAADLVAMPYSSGTTGLPKGVMLTHRNVVANIVQTSSALGFLGPDEVFLGVLPFFHIYGMVVVQCLALHRGYPVVTVPRFELEPFLQALQDHRVTFAPLVPPIILALAKHPVVENYRLQVKYICSGAAPLSEDLGRAAAERLGCKLFQGYGMTETSPVTHIGPLEGPHGTIGPPVANTECKVVDLISGRDLGPGENGEICIRGPQVMKGYLNRPEATAAMIDPQGWLHTGDIGHATAEGNFYVVDRVKELIKYKGLQIAPAELEAVLLTHPGVADAAVVGVPDAEAGEVPKAWLVLRGETTVAEVLAHLAAHVAPYKKIRSAEVIERIPKTPSGKILRRVLAESARARPSA